jgi:nicotinamidase/pyrazinamidase
MKIKPGPGDALVVVDIQNDFLPGGNLPVPQANTVVAVLDVYVLAFVVRQLPIFVTRCWHPEKHCSFHEQGGPWPAHCIAGSQGAEFPAGLALPSNTIVISKATEVDKDAYSGFDGTDLDAQLRQALIQRLFVGGMATEYCVLNTVQDALRLGYQAVLLQDAVRAVDAGDGIRALAQMRDLGAIFISYEQLA